MDEHGLLDSPGNVMCLPTYYCETVHNDEMFHGLAMLVDGGGGYEVLPEPFPEGPCQFPSILFLTIDLGAFVPVDYPTL